MEGCIRAANFVSSEATMPPFSIGLRLSEGKSHASLFTVLRTAEAPRVHRSGLSISDSRNHMVLPLLCHLFLGPVASC